MTKKRYKKEKKRETKIQNRENTKTMGKSITQ
jgi:hypothetical protein